MLVDGELIHLLLARVTVIHGEPFIVVEVMWICIAKARMFHEMTAFIESGLDVSLPVVERLQHIVLISTPYFAWKCDTWNEVVVSCDIISGVDPDSISISPDKLNDVLMRAGIGPTATVATMKTIGHLVVWGCPVMSRLIVEETLMSLNLLSKGKMNEEVPSPDV